MSKLDSIWNFIEDEILNEGQKTPEQIQQRQKQKQEDEINTLSKILKQKPKGKKLKTYQVYLILPHDISEHTTITEHVIKHNNEEKKLFYLNYNGWNYSGKELTKKGIVLYDKICNFLFLGEKDSFGREDITKGEATFSENAWSEIAKIDNSKVSDRVVEMTHVGQKKKYHLVKLKDAVLMLFVFGIVMFIILGQTLGTLPGTIAAENEIGKDAIIRELAEIINDGSLVISNNTIIVQNRTGIQNQTGGG